MCNRTICCKVAFYFFCIRAIQDYSEYIPLLQNGLENVQDINKKE